MGVNGEALQLHAAYKKPYFLLQVTRESVSVLQVTWKSVSGTASHARWVWTCNEIKGLYNKIIITIVQSYTRKNITSLLLSVLLRVCIRTIVIIMKLIRYCGNNIQQPQTVKLNSVICAMFKQMRLFIIVHCPKRIAVSSVALLWLPHVKNVCTFNFRCVVCAHALIIHHRKFFSHLTFAA